LADQFIFGVAPIDYSPVLLLMPFGFHLAMDTLPSESITASGRRRITAAFGYSAPHSSARGTLTLLSNALLSTHYGPSRHRLALDRFPGFTGYTRLVKEFIRQHDVP